MVKLFLESIVLGLAIAAPLGPIGTLCINRTLERGFWAGVAGGLGTALADAVYAGLAAAGFAAFSATLAMVDAPLKLAGGLFMIWLGWRGMTPRPPAQAARVDTNDLLATVAVTFVLTLANPATIFSFAAIFAGLGLAGAADPVSVAVVVGGVFVGSLGWWFALSGGVAAVHHRLPDAFARWVARISGGVLILFGLASLASFGHRLIAG